MLRYPLSYALLDRHALYPVSSYLYNNNLGIPLWRNAEHREIDAPGLREHAGRGRRQPWAGAIRPLHASLVLVTGLPRHSINMSALTKENIDKLPSGEAIHPSLFCSADRTFPFLIPSCDIAVTPGHRTPSLHQPVSRRSSISAGHGQSGGPMHNVDIGKIGIPVVTPRKERPSHKRSHTGKLSPDTADLC